MWEWTTNEVTQIVAHQTRWICMPLKLICTKNNNKQIGKDRQNYFLSFL